MTNIREQLFKEESFKDKLNLGCGPDYVEGWVNLDNNPDIKADVHFNIDDAGLPFEDGQFDLIYAGHILEHIRNLVELKGELHRILRIDGCLVIVVPYYLSPCAWGDDTHVRAFSEHSFFKDFWPGFTPTQLTLVEVKDSIGKQNNWLACQLVRGTHE